MDLPPESVRSWFMTSFPMLYGSYDFASLNIKCGFRFAISKIVSAKTPFAPRIDVSNAYFHPGKGKGKIMGAYRQTSFLCQRSANTSLSHAWVNSLV